MNRRTFLRDGIMLVGAASGLLLTTPMLSVVHAASGQKDWRWCHKCQGLFFAGNNSSGTCPTGGSHENLNSGNYSLVQNDSSAPGQNNWRWCHKCQGLFFAGNNSPGACPAGGGHENLNSGDYSLVQNTPGAVGQRNWRWCHKCQGLYFAGNGVAGSCPAGDTHAVTGSGDYYLTQAPEQVKSSGVIHLNLIAAINSVAPGSNGITVHGSLEAQGYLGREVDVAFWFKDDRGAWVKKYQTGNYLSAQLRLFPEYADTIYNDLTFGVPNSYFPYHNDPYPYSAVMMAKPSTSQDYTVVSNPVSFYLPLSYGDDSVAIPADS